MAKETGTATDVHDFLDKLIAFLTTNVDLVTASQQWTLLQDEAYPRVGVWPGRLAFDNVSTSYPNTFPDQPPIGMFGNNVKWKATGNLNAPSTGTYSFSLLCDESAFVRINGSVVGFVGSNNRSGTYTQTFTADLTAGNNAFEIVFFNTSGSDFGLSLGWLKPGDSAFEIIPSANYNSMVVRMGYQDLNTSSLTDMLLCDADREVVLHGTGLTGTDDIFISLTMSSSAVVGRYNLRIAYLTSYVADAFHYEQPGYEQPVYQTLWEGSIPYWFWANGRRFITMAKVSSIYASCYAGLLLPYGTPSEWGYPVAIGGNAGQNWRWDYEDDSHVGFWNPWLQQFSSTADYTSLVVRLPGGEALAFCNFTDGDTIQSTGRTHPYAGRSDDIRIPPVEYTTAPDGSHAIQPVSLSCDLGVLGEFDGVSWVTGISNSSENTLNDGTDNHIVFAAGTSSGSTNYAAIKDV